EKSQIIFTTNYDTIIEDTANEQNKALKKFIGQKGFFMQTEDWGEIYKLHGCATEPNSIVITKDDYDHFDRNSVLISAKIISLLLTSPIIFLGYSLNDRNVRKIIRDFSTSLSGQEKDLMSDRLILVNYSEGISELKEYKQADEDLD